MTIDLLSRILTRMLTPCEGFPVTSLSRIRCHHKAGACRESIRLSRYTTIWCIYGIVVVVRDAGEHAAIMRIVKNMIKYVNLMVLSLSFHGK